MSNARRLDPLLDQCVHVMGYRLAGEVPVSGEGQRWPTPRVHSDWSRLDNARFQNDDAGCVDPRGSPRGTRDFERWCLIVQSLPNGTYPHQSTVLQLREGDRVVVLRPAEPSVHAHVNYLRVPDDEFVDQVRFVNETDGALRARIHIEPRCKESDLSGDQWRTSAFVTVVSPRGPAWKDYVHTVKDAAAYLAHKLEGNELGTTPKLGATRLELFHKGTLLVSYPYAHFRDAVLSLPWRLIVGAEDAAWHDARWAEDRCFQIGCAEPWTVEYRVKHLYHHHARELKPNILGHDHRRRFCTAHRNRGDAAFDDAMSNYEPIIDRSVS